MGRVMRAPPVREFRDALRPWREVSPERRAEWSASDASCGPLALRRPPECAEGRERAGKRRRPSRSCLRVGRSQEIRRGRFRARLQISRLLHVQTTAIELVRFHSPVPQAIRWSPVCRAPTACPIEVSISVMQPPSKVPSAVPRANVSPSKSGAVQPLFVAVIAHIKVSGSKPPVHLEPHRLLRPPAGRKM